MLRSRQFVKYLLPWSINSCRCAAILPHQSRNGRRSGRSGTMQVTSALNSVSRMSTDCPSRSEEHTSELQSPCNLVCRLLLEKKKKKERKYDTQYKHNSCMQ